MASLDTGPKVWLRNDPDHLCSPCVGQAAHTGQGASPNFKGGVGDRPSPTAEGRTAKAETQPVGARPGVGVGVGVGKEIRRSPCPGLQIGWVVCPHPGAAEALSGLPEEGT